MTETALIAIQRMNEDRDQTFLEGSDTSKSDALLCDQVKGDLSTRRLYKLSSLSLPRDS